jgi:hypothetical protein
MPDFTTSLNNNNNNAESNTSSVAYHVPASSSHTSLPSSGTLTFSLIQLYDESTAAAARVIPHPQIYTLYFPVIERVCELELVHSLFVHFLDSNVILVAYLPSLHSARCSPVIIYPPPPPPIPPRSFRPVSTTVSLPDHHNLRLSSSSSSSISSASSSVIHANNCPLVVPFRPVSIRLANGDLIDLGASPSSSTPANWDQLKYDFDPLTIRACNSEIEQKNREHRKQVSDNFD